MPVESQVELPEATSDTIGANPDNGSQHDLVSRLKLRKQRPLLAASRPGSGNVDRLQDVYLGSYRSVTPRGSVDFRATEATSASRPSVSRLQLEKILPVSEGEVQTYGIEELRDGYFDASFNRPVEKDPDELKDRAKKSLPKSLRTHHPLSVRWFLPDQVQALIGVIIEVTTRRSGIKLLKSFLGFFICYIVCLTPTSQRWLGTHFYLMTVSAIINHPGRAVGSQIDGLVMTTLGTVAGLGWGSLALYVSTSTEPAKRGYGGLLAAFLVLFTAMIAWLRCVYLRFYQAIICAGFAICYMCLVDTSSNASWSKVFGYGVPWILGQAVCMIVAIFVFPDVGSRSLALRMHKSITTIRDSLEGSRTDNPALRAELALQFVLLSTGVRDFTIEFTVSRFRSDDVRQLRNMLQAVIRSILSIRSCATFFDSSSAATDEAQKLFIGLKADDLTLEQDAAVLIREFLAHPTRALIDAMRESLLRSNQVLLFLSGHSHQHRSIEESHSALIEASNAFDVADEALLVDPRLPSTYAKQPQAVEMLLFVHPLRQTADKVTIFTEKVMEVARAERRWRVLPPSYPWSKAIMRSNAQVRHDRGGLTAGFYFQSKTQLDRITKEMEHTTFTPHTRPDPRHDQSHRGLPMMGKYTEEQEMASKKNPTRTRKTKFRYRAWTVLHRLQGFESRFALKVTLITTLLSIPAWLDQSRTWWNQNQSWWAVVIVWSQMHPRVGGNVQDLIVRTGCGALGAVWAGFAFAADDGNPYVMAVFAAVYMLPMLYRFTQSNHPRSGFVGCLSFSVISLMASSDPRPTQIVKLAWTRGLAFVVGVAAAVIVNWILWPFVARHELRKSISAMILHLGIAYRSVLSRYIYYDAGDQPGPDVVTESEMLEGRLREVFVRIRQLLEMTRHELRLRAPFDPLPYSGLISSCESFFENIVRVRQSSLYFQHSLLPATTENHSSTTRTSLTTIRRDAAAAILTNLYILAISLRTAQPVPKYLPSAAVAREKLLDRMAVVEAEERARMRAAAAAAAAGIGSPMTVQGETSSDTATATATATDIDQTGHPINRSGSKRRWADVYEYAYSGALTDIVGELQILKRFTREICGEIGWE